MFAVVAGNIVPVSDNNFTERLPPKVKWLKNKPYLRSEIFIDIHFDLDFKQRSVAAKQSIRALFIMLCQVPLQRKF